jgi:hypothetical protein
MLTEEQVLSTLDSSGDFDVACFVQLGHPYSFLIDSRLNVFRGEDDKWAIVVERLGYNPRGGAIQLEVYYYGNCLSNLYHQPIPDCGYNIFSPIDSNNFLSTTTEDENINPDARFWLVRGTEVPLSHNRQDYLEAGIELTESEPFEVRIEEAARLSKIKYHQLFRATDSELYQAIPAAMRKILVLDEWFHKDYVQLPVFEVDESYIESMGLAAYENMKTNMNQYREYNENEAIENSPSSYETWQQIAKVIVSGDISLYEPTLAQNTHWKHWPDSGSL